MIGCPAGFSCIKSAAVVFDDDLNVPGGALQNNADVFRAGMFSHVIERFLNDAVDCRLNLSRNPGRRVLVEFDIHFDAPPRRPCRGEIADGFDQTEVVQGGWT
jgi:hypothetical protein